VAAARVPFVLPGTTLGMFPVGLIVTSAWLVVFIGVVGYGTWGRQQYRKQWRATTAAKGGRSWTPDTMRKMDGLTYDFHDMFSEGVGDIPEIFYISAGILLIWIGSWMGEK